MSLHLHILGIGGTFMGSLAVIAKQLGYQVSGQDANIYPPMSDQLADLGVEVIEGYHDSGIKPDLWVIGNTIKRGMPVLEAVLSEKRPFVSGPEWLHDHVLRNKWVLAVSGTHGKTTTTSMLAWILSYAGLKPGYLIGGVPKNFETSAHVGSGNYFVIEADEYDTAIFDKRSKFVHYHPQTLIINNLEFDHADVFDDLSQIQNQFHHLTRALSQEAMVIHPQCSSIQAIIDKGFYSKQCVLGLDWQHKSLSKDYHHFQVFHQGQWCGDVKGSSIGQFNADNALAAIAAAHHIGIDPSTAIEALGQYQGMKRRLELVDQKDQIHVYDDFAHHPTAVSKTLQAMTAKCDDGRVIAVLEPRSNTMRSGYFKDQLPSALKQADLAYVYLPDHLKWGFDQTPHSNHIQVFNDLNQLLIELRSQLKAMDHVVVMSNGSFGQIHHKILTPSRSILS